MEKKTFSVKDGTLVIVGSGLFLLNNDGDTEPIATTYEPIDKDNVYQLPSTLIRKPKTDEELAEEKYPYIRGDGSFYQRIREANIEGFLAGLKARGGEFHLTSSDIENIIDMARATHFIGFAEQYSHNLETIIDALTPSIYPTKITVDYDGENYYWGTLKAEY